MAKKKKPTFDEWMKDNYGITTSYHENVNAIKTAQQEDEIAPVKKAVKVGVEYDPIRFNTLESDLKFASTLVQGAYGGWTDADTLTRNKSTVSSVYDRLLAYQDKYGTNGVDITETVNSYKSALDNWDSLAEQYGNYKSADEYNTAVENYRNMATLDFAATEKEIKELESREKEYDKLKAERDSLYRTIASGYTRGRFNNNAASEKALSDPRIVEYDRRLAEYGDIEKEIAEKKIFLNQAKRLQEGISLESVADPNSENYDPEFEKIAQNGLNFKNPASSDAEPIFHIGTSKVATDGSVNKATYAQENKAYVVGGVNGGNSALVSALHTSLTEDEIKLYSYYFAKGEYEKADAYLEYLEETVNTRFGKKIGEQLEGKTALEISFGAIAGLDRGASGVRNAFNFEDDYIPATAIQVASQIVREDLYDAGVKLPEALGGASLGQVAYDAVSTTANMAPSILVGAINPVAGASVMGISAAGNAYQTALNNGWDKTQARTYSTLVGVSEAALSAMLSKAFGGKLTKPLENAINGIEKGYLKFAANYGTAFVSEGLEEGLQEILNPLFENIALGYEKNTLDDIDWSEAAYASLLGGLSGGTFESVNTVAGKVNGTNLTANEQKVFKKVYEDAIAEAEKSGKKLTATEKGKIREKVMDDLKRGDISTDTIEEVLGGNSYKAYKDTVDSETELQKEIESLQKEYDSLNELEIGEDRKAEIEKLLPELKQKLTDLQANSNKDGLKSKLSEEVFELAKQDGANLKRGSYLAESYYEVDRQYQKFEVDLNKYDGLQKESLEDIVKKGQVNNIRRAHEFWEYATKKAAERGAKVTSTTTAEFREMVTKRQGEKWVKNHFEELVEKYGEAFVNEHRDELVQKHGEEWVKKHLPEDVAPNGYRLDDGTIAINVDSRRVLEYTFGHEIGHDIKKGDDAKKTGYYADLQKQLFEYAEKKEGAEAFKKRRETIERLYADGVGDVDVELTNDLIGEYIFNDPDFIKHLSVKNRNLFQRLWDSVKHLYKLATAGSQEARDLERIKKLFEEAYRETANVKTEARKNTAENGGTNETLFSISKTSKIPYNDQLKLIEDGKMNGSNSLYVGKPSTQLQKAGFSDAPFAMNQSDYRKSRRKSANNEKYSSHAVPYDFFESLPEYMAESPLLIDNGVKTTVITSYGMKDTRGNDSYVIAGVWRNQQMESDTINQVKSAYPLDDFAEQITKAAESGKLVVTNKNKAEQMLATIGIQPSEVSRIISLANGTITQFDSDVNTEFSLSDSDGKQLTAEQQDYFKDSKVRDENGNLKVMYHGSQDAGFHIFDPNFSDDGTSFFFVDRNEAAASYSGTSEIYAPKAFKTTEDANKFFAEIGHTEYEVAENNGEYTLFDDGDEVAKSDSLDKLYEEWRDWSGLGYGDANYKVYLNLTNPLEVDAEGRNWNRISSEFSQEVYDRYKTLTAEEKDALHDLAEWEDIGIFRDGIREAANGTASSFSDDYQKLLASAYKKLGDVDMYRLFDIATDNFTEESLKENALKYLNTRDYAKRAKEQGYDGIVFKNIYDLGGYSNGSEGASTVAIAFDSNQIKSVANTQPTSDPDIRYSLSQDSEGREISDAVKKRFANTKVVDESGRLKTVYHGTASGEFFIFDKAKGSVEGDFGSGFYFTDNETDVEDHYEGGGPDFENKVIRRAEQLVNEDGLDWDEAEKKAREELFKGGYKHEVYLNIEKPAIVGETNLLESESYFDEYNQEDYDNEEDYYADVEQLVADDIDNIILEIERNVDVDRTDGIAEVLWEAFNDGGIGIEQLKAKLNALYLEDSEGNYVANEVARQIIESLGYDGIIDPTVSGKWNMEMEEGTTHYIVFKPNQIKSVTNQNPTDDPDIRHSLSFVDEHIPKGAAVETALKKRPTVEDIAPTQEDIAPLPTYNEPAADPTMFDLEQEKKALQGKTTEAMQAEDWDTYNQLAEEYQALEQRINQMQADEAAFNSERLATLDDMDAPIEQETEYYSLPDTTPLTKKAVNDISRSVSDALGLSRRQKAEVKALIEEYSASEFPSREELYAKIEERFGVQTAQESQGVEGVQAFLRDSKIKVSDTIKGDIADYNNLRKSLFHKIGFAKDGLDVDSAYQELTDLYPEFFPEDIVNPTDQFLRMVEVAKLDKAVETEYELDSDTIMEAADIIINEVSTFRENHRRTAAEREARHFPKVAPVEDGDIAPVPEAYEAIRPSRPIRPKRETQRSNEPRMIRVDSNNGRPGEKQRKWVKTSTDSEAVDGKVLPEDLNQDTIHYQPISNKTTLGKANARLDGMGYESSVDYFNNQFSNKRISLDDVALGERLIQEAIKRGDTKTAGELIQNVAILGTELGQKVQALSIIKRLTPEGQLRMLQKTIERGKTKGDKAYDGVELTQEMIDKILKTYGKDGAYDQAKLNEAVEDVKQQIADKMKVSKMDKVNAWRYLSMLGNPKTHIRNLVSNIAMRGTVAVKNVIARSIEDIAPIKNRTKTWKSATDAVKSFSQKTAAEMKDILSDGGKYSEDASIKVKRAIFKNKILNGLYEFNSDLLSKEDWWFSKPAFTNSLSEYLTANGIQTEQDIANNPEIIEKAKQYATEQSQIATFRQYSWLANKINDIERHNAFTDIAVGAILPFKKTPINIAKTGLNYSPLGFAKTLTYDISQVKNGKMEASDLVDHLAQNATGTALALIGYMLASAGLISGGGEDDKEGDYDYQLGEQSYSLNIGGKSYSLSWLSPVAMPLFVGANAHEQLVEGKEWNGDVVVETLAQTLDPLSEMSFLSSLNQVLSSYDSGIEKFAGIGESMIQNYVTQFVPTLSSQVATVLDDTKRSTKVAGDSDFRFVDETINKLKLKIPGLRETLEPSTDIWGNEIKQTEDIFTRAFETFLSPANKKDNIATEIDAEIKSLYREVGDSRLIPSIPDNYVNYKNEKHKMSANEYTEFKKAYGQTAYDLLEGLFDTKTYQNASSEDKTDWVKKVYDYARDEALRRFLAEKGVEYTNSTLEGKEYYKENPIKGAIEYDMSPDEYSFMTDYPEKYSFFKENGISYEDYASADEDGKRAYSWAAENPESVPLAKAIAGDIIKYRQYASELYDIKADKDEDGKSISGSRKEKVIEWINNLDADYGEKIILFKSQYNADDTYNYEIVDYLKSRDDISYEEMEAILKELGFTVKADGTITW